MNEPKKVQIYPFIETLHGIQKTLVTHPPEGYVFIGAPRSSFSKVVARSTHSKLIRFLYHQFLKVFKTTKIIDAAQKAPILEEADLVYGGIHNNISKPWVAYLFDHPTCISGNNYDLFIKNKPKIEQAFLADQCKKILVANEAHIEFMKQVFSQGVLDKVEIVRPAYEAVDFKRTYKKKKVKIIFMGSINIPQDVYIKGGREVIKVFKILSKRNDVELVMRCIVPEELKPQLKEIKNLTLLEDTLPFSEILDLYKTADIVFMPGHNYSVSTFIESMAFSLPIVAMNTYSVEDFVKDKYTGIIVKRSDKVKGYTNKAYPTYIRSDEFMNDIKTYEDPELIKRLVKALEKLIDNPSLRKELSENARKEFLEKYTIEVRNSQIKKVFDEILFLDHTRKDA
ncbi:MAG: glycosyltransferase family 4 protein [Nanoarchaeota archaeon]|nr:glycosyltransferase family 4 protein [Nanoarchaeota archaeon]